MTFFLIQSLDSFSSKLCPSTGSHQTDMLTLFHSRISPSLCFVFFSPQSMKRAWDFCVTIKSLNNNNNKQHAMSKINNVAIEQEEDYRSCCFRCFAFEI